jgi:hypothetical protein
LEYHLAAIWALYQPDKFFELDGELQSVIVAAYRASNQIEAVIAREQTKEADRARRRAESAQNKK